MPWKKILIAAALLLVVLIAAAYVILFNLDFNRFKPQITQLVFDATGRKLTIGGSIDINPGIRPILVVEDVGLENATWGLKPDLIRVKRLEVQLAFLPLIWGKIDFAHLVAIQPEVIVEFDSAGTSNFAFDTSSKEEKPSPLPPPPLIFSDIQIENGRFTYNDVQSEIRFTVRIDHLTGEIEGFDGPLNLDFKGAFDDIPLSLAGSVGPIWAWVEPGYSMPADLKVISGSATATIQGELRDPINLKDLGFEIAAHGSSVAEITRQVGLSGVPELGAFRLKANLNDSSGNLAVEKLDIQIENQELAAISLRGDLKDVLALQGVNLNFSAKGEDSAHLTRIGFPALLERGAFEVTAQIADPEENVYTASDLRVVLGENVAGGQLNLNLAQKVPLLTARLTSQQFEFGQFNLNLEMAGPAAKPAVKKIDFKIGTPALAEIRLNGKVDDLKKLEGVDIKFQARGKNLANFEKLTGKPMPVRGAFSAAGKVLIPVHKNIKIPDLKVTAGKNHITGSLNLDSSGQRPHLVAKLALSDPDLPSVLLPKLAKQGWAKGLGQVRPVKLDVTLDGFAREMALKKVDLRAGTLNSVKLHLTGSVQNLTNLRGIDLNFSLQGDEVAKLHEIIAQPNLFAPLPGQGEYAISGKISDPAVNNFKVHDLKFALAGTELTGWVDINQAAQPPQYEVNLSGPKFNMKPFPIPKKAAYAHLNKIDDLGPLKIHSKVTIGDAGLSLQYLDLQAGSEQLAAVDVKGSIKNFKKQKGIDLKFNIRGNEIANLKKITGQSIPLKGAYGLSGKLTDPAPKKYKLGDLALKLGENNISGALDLNLSAKQLRLAADLAAPKFTLQPVTLPALETLSRIEDLGPLKLAFKLAGAGKTFTLDNLDLKLGRQDLVEVLLKGTISDLSAVQGIKLEFIAKGNDLSNFKKLGGPQIPFKGAFNVTAQFIDPAPKVYKISTFDARVGDNNQSGWLELDLSSQRPRLTGELSSDKLDLRPLWAQDKETSTAKAQSSKPVPRKDKKSQAKTRASGSGVRQAKVFSAEPIQLKGLQIIDADLKFRDKQVLLPALALDDVILDVLLKNGNLEIKPFKFSIGGGKADVQFALRSEEKPAAWAVNLDIDQLEIGPMLDKLGYQRSVEGNMDAAFNLDGSGDSIAALMAGLNGNTRIAMSDGRAASEYLELLEKYLGSGILGMINPFQENREYTPVNCFVNQIEIKDGLADVKLLLDTDRTSLFGAGDVNLKTEGLDLGIKPTPKKGAMPARISFSFKELSQPFRLGGTLAHPQLAIDPGRTAFVIGKLAGAVALGPVGIAAFFADVSVGKQDACAVALGTTTIEAEKKEEKKSGGFFRRLFGK
jgi:uncharacterized protein involved in outer membrane biogenesis